MNLKVKEKWLKALRSGEYQQIKGSLKSVYNKGFCCLGVLCEIYQKETGNGEWRDRDGVDDSGPSFIVYDETGGVSKHDSVLPDHVRSWAGLSQSNPSVDCENEEGDVALAIKEIRPNTHLFRTSLSELNDDGGTFDQIANVIEAGL